MADDHGIDAARFAHAAFRKIVQIGTADADGGDAYLNLAWPRVRGRRRIHETKRMGLVKFSDLHR
jgi:hypothetical protein